MNIRGFIFLICTIFVLVLSINYMIPLKKQVIVKKGKSLKGRKKERK